jgi:peptidoglycan/xylan/chitin deacetylase (PgdA/CDA1 family)
MKKLHRLLARHLPVNVIRSRLEAPVASISFDDFPRSAWTTGDRILQRYDAKATYYVSGRFCGQFEDGLAYYTADDLQQIRDTGHEIGCHTFSHRHVAGVKTGALHADATRNQAFVSEIMGDYRLVSFAYPYGDVSPRTKFLFARRFSTSRGISGGVNAGLVDLAQLKAIGLSYGSWDPAAIESAVQAAVQRTGWIIFYTHDVSDNPTIYGSTPEMLDHALSCVRAASIDILPIKNALDLMVFR